LKVLYFTAGYPPRGENLLTQAHADVLRRLLLLVVQDCLPSPVSAVARYVLPAATFAEKDGTFVNHAGLAQAIRRATRPPGDLRTDGQVFLDLMESGGLVHAPTLRAELARDVPYFASLPGELDEYGVFLSRTGQ
jgi:NADH-quinone oxidoreductase subunit G